MSFLADTNPNVLEAERLLEEDLENDSWFERWTTKANLFDFVTDQLAIGAGPYSFPEAQAIYDAGIRTVIDCRIESRADRYWRKLPGVDYLWTGFDDDLKPKGPNTFRNGLRVGLSALDRGEKVLTHCAAGMNRGPSMGYALLRAYYKLKPAAAFKAIQGVRPICGIVYAADVERALIELGYERS